MVSLGALEDTFLLSGLTHYIIDTSYVVLSFFWHVQNCCIYPPLIEHPPNGFASLIVF